MIPRTESEPKNSEKAVKAMKKSFKLLVCAVTALTMTLPAIGEAAGPASLGRELGRAGHAFVPAAQRVAAPFASIIFCGQNPQECRAPRSRNYALEIRLTQKRASELQDVNLTVNKRIRPVEDDSDTWSLEPAAGDCEDYAISKRHELIARGWPPQTLRLAVVYTPFGEGHMVLVVRTDKGDMVLDNRNGSIRPWNKTGLRWVMIQSPVNPARWMKVAANIS